MTDPNRITLYYSPQTRATGTRVLLEELGAPADFVPPSYVADSLIEHFPVSGWGLRLLLPRVQSGGRFKLIYVRNK